MSDEDAVRAVVQLYVDGANGDTAKLEQAFHESATMTGAIGPMADTFTPIADFIGLVSRNPGLAGPNYAADVRSVDITGDVGVAVLVETDYFGCDFVDYFTMARFDDTWKIIAKSYAHTGGAPSREIH